MTKLLEVKNLHVSYHTYAGEVQSVRGISFELEKGECMAIVGESGCGKTVTAKSIMGLIQSPPGEIKKESKILFNGKNVLDFSNKDWQNYRGNDVSMIFQDPMTSLNPTMKIGKQISENIMKHKGFNKTKASEETIKILEMVEIPNAKSRLNQYPHEFSGGMRQRAMIGIALACNPKILIGDEPTTALDVTIQAQIIDLMKDLQQRLGTAIMLITHDLGVVADIAKKIVVMYAGKIVEKGLADEIFYSPQHPYTFALLKSIPRLDSNKGAELISIQGAPPDLISPPIGCPFVTRCKYCMTICREQAPEITILSPTHEAACWLHHPLALLVDLPIIRGDNQNGK